jgi:FkbM family methyltransferase
MKALVKRVVIGTPFERVARILYGAIGGRRAGTLRPPTGPSVQDKNRLYDLETIQVMRRVLTRSSNCIDVGCHQGSILTEMLQLAPAGTHFAFEPLPDLYQGLRGSFGALANVRLHEVALSDVAGRTSFQHVVSNPGYSGLLRRTYDRPEEQVREIEVRVERLDNLIPGDIGIDLIKVDVEGAELGVFRGGVETIRRNRPVIIFEHGLGAADCYGSTPEVTYDLLAGECGLKLSLMAEWLESGGRKTLSRDAFCDQFWSRKNFYFMTVGRTGM